MELLFKPGVVCHPPSCVILGELPNPSAFINGYLLSNFKFTSKFKVFVEIIKNVHKYSSFPLPSMNVAELYFPPTRNLDIAMGGEQNNRSPKMSMP